jgi:YidC/Oxa1 family membrane protein insertase
MQPQNNPRNTILFIVLMGAFLVAYEFFVLQPYMKRQHDAEQRAQAAAARSAPAANVTANLPGAPAPAVELKPAQALALASRIPIRTPSLSGSISTSGAVIDDLLLTQYRETTDKRSPPVRLLSPIGAPFAYFGEFSWLGQAGPLFPRNAAWTAEPGQTLTPEHPVTLTLVSGPATVRRTIAVDDRYMFTISDTVINNTSAPLTVRPTSQVERAGIDPAIIKAGFGVFQGAVGVINDKLTLTNFQKWKKNGGPQESSKGGWAGITDKYWMAAVIPSQSDTVNTSFQVPNSGGVDVYQAGYVGPARVLAPGASTTETAHFFAGAKVAAVLKDYQTRLGVPKFDSAIDWGWFFFLTRPMFWLLDFFFRHLGSFGIAILALTVVVRAFLFMPANQGFASMSKMKKLQPKIEDIKKRYANDQAKQQQEMMALYQREKINPLAGCLPILIQIPVFIALVKLLSATIEMRHAPFLFIKDLADRDPTTIWNLFGLIPWDPATAPLIGGFLDGRAHIGVIALLYLGSMYLQQAMSPVAGDPTQQQMMKFMPLIFIFFLAYYPVGLMIYWIWSTFISIAQQYVLMHRHGVENPIDGFIARLRGAEQEKEAPG